MSSKLRTCLTVVLITLFASLGLQADIAGGPHDLTATGINISTGTVGYGDNADGGLAAGSVIDRGNECRYCHAPHDTDTIAPLWDRWNDTSRTFDTYDSPTMDDTSVVAGVSLACMSCHDGQTASDAIGGADSGNAATYSMTNAFGTVTTDAIVGLDLTNDHPIGVSVDAGDLDFDTATNIITAGLPLYDDGAADTLVECASCHDPHDDWASNDRYFMRLADPSDLCTTCHIK